MTDTLVRPAFVLTPPDAATNAADDVVDLAATAGLVLDEWQCLALELFLGERRDGKWSARTVGLIVPRQNGKGSILEARVLAGLFLFGEAKIVWSAHEFKTAQDAYKRLRELIRETPWMEALVVRDPNNNVETAIELANGCSVKFVARTGGSGRGLGGDLVILDEAFQLSEDIIDALTPIMRARPNAQIWYTSSAPRATIGSEPLRRICRRGRRKAGTRPGRLAYAEWCHVPADGVEFLDIDEHAEDLWIDANPGIPVGRVDIEGLREDVDNMSRAGFLTETLGIWVDPEDVDLSASVMPGWSDLADPDAALTLADPLTLSVEVSWDRSLRRGRFL